jgi:hypothetical protein
VSVHVAFQDGLFETGGDQGLQAHKPEHLTSTSQVISKLALLKYSSSHAYFDQGLLPADGVFDVFIDFVQVDAAYKRLDKARPCQSVLASTADR